MLIKNKSNLINIIKSKTLNIICSNHLASLLPNNLISALIIDDNTVCLKDIYKLYKGNIDNFDNIDGIILDVAEYSKQQILEINKKYLANRIDVLYKVNSVNDIVKIRSLRAEIIIIGSDDISLHNMNPYILKMLIDWDAVCLLNCPNDFISMQHILEYGFSGIYTENYINTENLNINENIKSSGYLSKLYMKKSSIRPLLKVSHIYNNNELDICIKKDIDMIGFLFDKYHKSNIISMLNSLKNKNCVKVLEVNDSNMIEEALYLVNLGLADCIENNTNIQNYIVNSYKRYSLMNNKNTYIVPIIVNNIDNIKNNISINNPLWLSFQDDIDMMSIIKEYKVELIEFDIKKYNTIDKITEIIKKIKYKQ